MGFPVSLTVSLSLCVYLACHLSHVPIARPDKSDAMMIRLCFRSGSSFVCIWRFARYNLFIFAGATHDLFESSLYKLPAETRSSKAILHRCDMVFSASRIKTRGS